MALVERIAIIEQCLEQHGQLSSSSASVSQPTITSTTTTNAAITKKVNSQANKSPTHRISHPYISEGANPSKRGTSRNQRTSSDFRLAPGLHNLGVNARSLNWEWARESDRLRQHLQRHLS